MRIKEMSYGRDTDEVIVVLTDDRGFQFCCPATETAVLVSLLRPVDLILLREHLDLPCLVA